MRDRSLLFLAVFCLAVAVGLSTLDASIIEDMDPVGERFLRLPGLPVELHDVLTPGEINAILEEQARLFTTDAPKHVELKIDRRGSVQRAESFAPDWCGQPGSMGDCGAWCGSMDEHGEMIFYVVQPVHGAGIFVEACICYGDGGVFGILRACDAVYVPPLCWEGDPDPPPACEPDEPDPDDQEPGT